LPKIPDVILSIYFRNFVVPDHILSERVAVTENDIEHLQDDVDNIAEIMRTTAKAHDEKFEELLTVVRATNAKMVKYEIGVSVALSIATALAAGLAWVMSIFGISIMDLWGKK